MSPVPSKDRLQEYAVKGVHLGLREIGQAPEQRHARSLVQGVELDRAEPGAPRVLFLTPRSWAVHVQWEAMIGQALRLRGADVRFLGCGGGLEICDRANTWEAPPMPCGTCAPYVRDSIAAHGFPFDELADAWGDVPGDWPELDELSLHELGQVTYRGLALGAIVDIPVKWFLMRASIEDDPLAPMTFRRFLRSARRITDAVERQLESIAPDHVVLCNGLFLFEAVAFEVCRQRGIDVATYERGLIKETLIFRKNAPACLLDITPFWDRWSDVALSTDEQGELDAYLDERRHGRRTIDRYWGDAVFDAPERSSSGRLATLFPNLTWDSAVIGQSVAFDGLEPWVIAAIEHFAGRPEDELVIRVHPAEAKLPGKQTREPVEALVRDRYPELPPNVRLIGATDTQSSYPLIEASDAILVFSSTTGLEASLMGKPVIVSGQTHYRDKGFTIDVSSPAEFARAIDDVLAEPAAFVPDAELSRRYAYLLFFRAPVSSPGVEEHVLGLARLTIGSLDELRPGVDVDLDRICDGIIGDGDFSPLRD